MTEKEAIEVIKRVYNVSCPDHEDEMLYEKAIELAIKALEKQIPKKVTDRYMLKECPNCGEIEIQYCNHCPRCGQKLDWRENNEENE